MKKTAVVILLTLILAGCGILSPQPAPQADNNLVQTQAALYVEQTMSVMQAKSIETDVYNAVVAGLTQEAASYTATPAPSETSVPSATIEAIITLAIPTSTLTVIPAVNYVSSEYIEDLGTADVKDAFNSGANWYTYDTGDSSAKVKSGVMRMTMEEPHLTSDWTLSYITGQNFYAEITAQTQDECEGKDRYGIMFRAQDLNTGYLFMFSCDGRYRLTTWNGATAKLLAGWSKSSHINDGPDETNVMGVLANGNQIMLFANGDHLRTIYDDTYLATGRFGLIIGSDETDDLTIEYDTFKVWYLD